MKLRNFLLLAAILGVTALTFSERSAVSQPPSQPPGENLIDSEKGVEPLPRGPIHEAFAEPVTANPRPNPIVPKKPPDPVEEVPPDEKPEGNNVVWIPGYWAWDEDTADFIWVSGLWRDVPPDRQWIPGYWTEADGGWQWISGYWTTAGQTEVEYLPPPPQSLETGPSAPAPDDNSFYVPGCWVYQQTRYLWRPGFWMAARPDWIYTPAFYNWTPAGCVFVEGYWDYPLPRRGLLFCPARFAPGVWQRPGWYYQPTYVVSETALLSSLFVRPDFHRYHFGDYFEPRYAREGYVPWFDYRVARNVPEPIWNHYRWQHRTERGWEENVRAHHAERVRGDALRPPRTFAEQRRLIQEITTSKTVQINGRTLKVRDPQRLVNNLVAVAPLSQVKQMRTDLKFQRLPKDHLVQERKVATQLRTAAEHRRQVETKLVGQAGPPRRPTDPPRKAKLSLPQPPASAKAPRVQAPPRPQPPRHVEKPLPKHEEIRPIRVPPHPAGKEAPAVKPRPDVKPAPRPDVKPPPKPEVKPAPKPQVKPTPRPEVKPVPQPKPEVKPIPPAPKPEVKPVLPRPEVKPPAPAPKPAPPAFLPKPAPPAPKPLPPAVHPPAPAPKPTPPAVHLPPAPAPKPAPPVLHPLLPVPKPAPSPPAVHAPPAPKPASPAVHPAPPAIHGPPAPAPHVAPTPPAPRPQVAPSPPPRPAPPPGPVPPPHDKRPPHG